MRKGKNYYGQQNYWCDIESTIERLVAERDNDGTTICSRVSDRLNGELTSPAPPNTRKIEKDIEDFLRKKSNDQHTWTTADVANILLSELNKLEKAFSDYLCEKVAKNENYARNARHLLEQMIMVELPDENHYDTTTSVLDFNYTDPLAEFSKSAERYSKERPLPTLVNIHGSLEKGNTIFGIDGTKYMDDPNILPFTKTYRLLSLDNPDTAKLIHTHSTQEPKDDSTAMIKFYGHSLAQADYAYFQAIFDGVDLYESQTRLIFFYRPWKKDDGTRVSDTEARADMNRKVARLLSTYGSTLDNKDHGKNLMHKLLIEGRLSVKTI